MPKLPNLSDIIKVTDVTAIKRVNDKDVRISIAGEGFAKATSVYFFHDPTSTKVSPSGFTIVSDKQIDAVCPECTDGQMAAIVIVDFTVEGEVLQTSKSTWFQYINPPRAAK